MKSHLIKIIIVVFAAMGIVSCKKVGGDVNVNPNQSSNLSTGYAFTSALQYLGGTGGGLGTTNINSAAGQLYAQYLSETFYTQESRFSLRQYDYSGYYTGPLEDLQQVIDFNTNASTKSLATTTAFGSANNQIAAARILRAFIYLTITDRWGDVPYSQALQGNQNFTPVFDPQSAIYTSLFRELTEAQAQFDSGATLTNDILFAGDNTKWKHWANSLRAIMALRLSKEDPTTGRTEFQKAINDGVMTSNGDNVVYEYQNELNNENPYYNNYRSRYDYAVSATLVNYLKTYNDPRLPVYVAPTASGTYVGLVYGTTGSDLNNFSIGNRVQPGNISQIGTFYSSQNSPVTWTSYARVLFTQAEAAHLGWIAGGETAAADLYTRGIRASLEENGVATAAITTYLAQAQLGYTAANAVAQINTQKWLAGFMHNGWESWAEYRRTGYPVLLDPVPTALSPDKRIPRRQQYPQTEHDLNLENYNAVMARQGPDLLTTHVWWDKP
jgi:hypothetical protein